MKYVLGLIFLAFVNIAIAHSQVTARTNGGSNSVSSKVEMPMSKIYVGAYFDLSIDPQKDNLRITNELDLSVKKEYAQRFELSIILSFQPLSRSDVNRSVLRKIIITDRNAIASDKYFAISELFSFSDYDWEKSTTRIGLSSTKIRVRVVEINLNGKKISRLPKWITKCNFQTTTGSNDNRFNYITSFLFQNNIYPNRTAFDLFYSYNSELFSKKKTFKKEQEFANSTPIPFQDLSYEPPVPFTAPKQADNSIKPFIVTDSQIIEVGSRIDSLTKLITNNRLVKGNRSAISQNLSRIKNKINLFKTNNSSISDRSAIKIFSLLNYVFSSFEEKLLNNLSIERKELKSINECLDEIEQLLITLFDGKAYRGSSQLISHLTNICLYTDIRRFIRLADFNKGLINVEVSTASSPNFDKLTNGMKVYCIPWALRDLPIEEFTEGKYVDLLQEFKNLSSPTNRLIPIGRYKFFSLGQEKNLILDLKESGSIANDIKLRPSRGEVDNFIKWILYGEKTIKLLLQIESGGNE